MVRLASPDTGQNRWKWSERGVQRCLLVVFGYCILNQPSSRHFCTYPATGMWPDRPLLAIYINMTFKTLTRPLVMHSALLPTFASPTLLQISLFAAFALPAGIALADPDPGSVPPEQEVFVTATRTPQEARDVLADHVVIGSEEIQNAGQSSLVELLSKKRGIEITTNGGAGSTASVFIRGAQNFQNIVLVDGVRVGNSTTGGATWENIPLSHIDRIEIVYGPMSSVYGPDAVGGVIQIFTKQGDGAAHASASLGVGSYGLRQLQANVSGATKTGSDASLRYSLEAAHDEASGFSATKPSAVYSYNPDKDGYNKDSVNARLDFDWSKGHTVGFSLIQSRNNAQFDEGPGFDDRSIENFYSYQFYSRDQVTQTWTSLVRLARTQDKDRITNNTYGPSSHYGTTQDFLTWQNDLALGSNLLQWVLERREEKVSSDTTELAGQRNTNAIGLSYQWKSDQHLAVASLRNDNSDQFGSHTTGSLAYGYRFTPTLRGNLSIGSSFRAPTFNELYFPGYGIPGNKPEQGRNVEAGLHYESGTTQIDLVYYHNQVRDLLVYAPVCPVLADTHPYGCSYNVDQALLTGISLGGKFEVDHFVVHASLDLQDPQDQTTHLQLQRRAREHASVDVKYQAGNWQAGVETLVTSKRYDDSANTVVLGGYGIVNAHASVDIASNWTVFGRWNNVLNKNYEQAFGYATPGSNVFVGVRYGFK